MNKRERLVELLEHIAVTENCVEHLKGTYDMWADCILKALDQPQEVYRCLKCKKDMRKWFNQQKHTGFSCDNCGHFITLDQPQEEREQVCEKNCPDYKGMEKLHIEQCSCSCHDNLPQEEIDIGRMNEVAKILRKEFGNKKHYSVLCMIAKQILQTSNKP